MEPTLDTPVAKYVLRKSQIDFRCEYCLHEESKNLMLVF
jgi:hypothetical protein